MSRIILFLTLILQLAAKQNGYSQTTTDKKQQFVSLGNFLLENGQQIVDCQISYRTSVYQNEVKLGSVNILAYTKIFFHHIGGNASRC